MMALFIYIRFSLIVEIRVLPPPCPHGNHMVHLTKDAMIIAPLITLVIPELGNMRKERISRARFNIL